MGVLSKTKKILEVKYYTINSLDIKQYHKVFSIILKTSKGFHVLHGNFPLYFSSASVFGINVILMGLQPYKCGLTVNQKFPIPPNCLII